MAKKLISYDDQKPGLGLPDVVEGRLDTTYAPVTGSMNYLGQVKDVGGGAVPTPMRAPTLVIDRTWPDGRSTASYIPHWVDRGTNTVYALAHSDRAIWKSTDGGNTWEFRGKVGSNGSNGVFVKSSDTGTMIIGTAGAPPRLARSTDDGATWTNVHTMPTSSILMGAQSVTVDAAGHFYAVEYTTSTSKTEILVVRSTDDGATWHTLHAFPGPATSSPDKIRHIHSIQTDPISGRTFIMTGDSEPASGIYVVDGDDVVPWILNREVPPVRGGYVPRAIGMMFFPTHIAWASDSSAAGIYRVPREDETAEAVEEVYRISSTGWFSIRAADDNSRWLIASSDEKVSSRIDGAAHLYAVEDNGATVWEVASLADDHPGFSTFAPIGLAECSGDEVWIKSHGAVNSWAMKGTLGYGGISFPKPAPAPIVWGTRSAGPLSLTTEQSEAIVAEFTVPANHRTLYIYDMGINSVGGRSYIEVRNKDTGERVNPSTWTDKQSEKLQGQRESAEYLHRITGLDAYTSLQVRVYATSVTDPREVTAYITFGWGPIV